MLRCEACEAGNKVRQGLGRLPGAVRDSVERVDETSDHDHEQFDSHKVNDLLDVFYLVVLLVINGPLELSMVDSPLLGVVKAYVV